MFQNFQNIKLHNLPFFFYSLVFLNCNQSPSSSVWRVKQGDSDEGKRIRGVDLLFGIDGLILHLSDLSFQQHHQRPRYICASRLPFHFSLLSFWSSLVIVGSSLLLSMKTLVPYGWMNLSLDGHDHPSSGVVIQPAGCSTVRNVVIRTHSDRYQLFLEKNLEAIFYLIFSIYRGEVLMGRPANHSPACIFSGFGL